MEIRLSVANWDEAVANIPEEMLEDEKVWGVYKFSPGDKWDPVLEFFICAEYNPPPFNLNSVKKVLCLCEGSNDKDDWVWVVVLNDRKSAYLVVGWCDYTGWECRSGAEYTLIERYCINWELEDAS